jgi:ankyrin repeat protein
MLLNHKADVNFMTNTGFVPLMMALRHKNARVAEALIAAKADVNFAAADGQCPLSCAVVDCPDFAETLLKAGAKIPTDPIDIYGMSFLELAIRNNVHSLVETMLPSADLTALDAAGNNFVATTARFGDEKMMSLVLKHATVDQVNAVNSANSSALDIAVFSTPAVVRLLLDAKAEVNRSSADPILFTATIKIKNDTMDMLQTLVEAGADIEARGSKGDTVLHVAAFRGLTVVADTLISLKADVNTLNDRGLTPLVAAISKGYTDVAESLLAAGGTATGQQGGLLLGVNARRGDEVAVDILLKANADIDTEAECGFTPLKAALHEGHLRIVEKLIAAGADTVTDRKGLIGICRMQDIDPAVIGVATD